MKKSICLFLSVVLLLLPLAGCQHSPGKDASTDSSATASGAENKDVSQVSGEDVSGDTHAPEPKPEQASFKAGDVLHGEKGLIRNLSFVTEERLVYNKIELRADLSGIADNLNVFDEKDVEYSIRLTSPEGKTLMMPGFYYQEYKFTDDGRTNGQADTKPDFRLRFALTSAGSWDFVVTLKIRGEEKDTVSGYINVSENKDNHGFLQVEKKRKQTFQFSDGTGFAAVGENIAGSYESASMRSAEMIKWMTRCAEYGANFTRIWLSQWLLSLQKNGYAPSDLSGGMSDAAQIDRIVEAWERLGMYGQVCLFTFNQLSDDKKTEGENAFYAFPYNKATKGGYIANPPEFFTNERAITDTKIYLRYMVARYGYSTHVFGWELFNEADGCTGYRDVQEEVRQWHVEMANYLRSVDPYTHLITTSTTKSDDVLNCEIALDYMSLHKYEYGVLSNLTNLQKTNWQLYQRPVILGECGYVTTTPRLDEDLINFHQQNWVGLMGGGAGTAQSWWWETVDRLGAYWDFQVVSEMAQHIPWSSDNMFMVDTSNTAVDSEQVEILGYRGDDFAYLWMYDNKYSHLNKVVTDFNGVKFHIRLKDGTYHVRWIDTWTGVSIQKTEETAVDGYLELTTPAWCKDVAVAITVD